MAHEGQYPPIVITTHEGFVFLFHDLEGLEFTIDKLQDLLASAKAGELGDAPYMWGVMATKGERGDQGREWFDQYTDFLKGRLQDD